MIIIITTTTTTKLTIKRLKPQFTINFAEEEEEKKQYSVKALFTSHFISSAPVHFKKIHFN